MKAIIIQKTKTEGNSYYASVVGMKAEAFGKTEIDALERLLALLKSRNEARIQRSDWEEKEPCTK